MVNLVLVVTEARPDHQAHWGRVDLEEKLERAAIQDQVAREDPEDHQDPVDSRVNAVRPDSLDLGVNPEPQVLVDHVVGLALQGHPETQDLEVQPDLQDSGARWDLVEKTDYRDRMV